MEKEFNLTDERMKLLKYLIEQFGEKSLIPQDIFRFVIKQDKEFINIHIEDLDWLWEIHPKIYNRIVAKFKERAGPKLIK